VQTLLRSLAVAGVEPYASRLKAAPDEIVQMFEPQEINIAVTGGRAARGMENVRSPPRTHGLDRLLALTPAGGYRKISTEIGAEGCKGL